MAHTQRTPASGPQTADPPREWPDAHPERRGCLFALAQLPLIIFLGFIGLLLLLGALHDLLLL